MKKTLVLSNWANNTQKVGVTEESVGALAKAHRQERQMIRMGYRWIRVNERMTVLVPCDDNGKPTKEGERRIERMRNHLAR